MLPRRSFHHLLLHSIQFAIDMVSAQLQLLKELPMAILNFNLSWNFLSLFFKEISLLGYKLFKTFFHLDKFKEAHS